MMQLNGISIGAWLLTPNRGSCFTWHQVPACRDETWLYQNAVAAGTGPLCNDAFSLTDVEKVDFNKAQVSIKETCTVDTGTSITNPQTYEYCTRSWFWHSRCKWVWTWVAGWPKAPSCEAWPMYHPVALQNLWCIAGLSLKCSQISLWSEIHMFYQ